MNYALSLNKRGQIRGMFLEYCCTRKQSSEWTQKQSCRFRYVHFIILFKQTSFLLSVCSLSWQACKNILLRVDQLTYQLLHVNSVDAAGYHVPMAEKWPNDCAQHSNTHFYDESWVRQSRCWGACIVCSWISFHEQVKFSERLLNGFTQYCLRHRLKFQSVCLKLDYLLTAAATFLVQSTLCMSFAVRGIINITLNFLIISNHPLAF